MEYARAVVEDGLGDVAVAFIGDAPAGAEVFYSVKLAAKLCVHYYVGVLEQYRKRGLGKALVSAVEGFCRAEAYAATTTEDNNAARALFSSLGYKEYKWEELDRRTRDLLLKATCGYDDDIVFVKGLPPRELARAPGDAERFGRKECYLVWLRLRRGF